MEDNKKFVAEALDDDALDSVNGGFVAVAAVKGSTINGNAYGKVNKNSGLEKDKKNNKGTDGIMIGGKSNKPGTAGAVNTYSL